MKTPNTDDPSPLGAHSAAALNLELLERAQARTARSIAAHEETLAHLRARRDGQEKERARLRAACAKGPR